MPGRYPTAPARVSSPAGGAAAPAAATGVTPLRRVREQAAGERRRDPAGRRQHEQRRRPARRHADGPLRHAARLIREFHDAVTGFTPPPDAHWQTLTPAPGDEIIAHHDLAPWNLIAGDQRWAFIDWDTAGPGTRLWDLAYATHGFVPLSADPAYQRDDAGRRLRLIADAYGLTERQRLDIVPLLGLRTRVMHDFLAEQAARGAQPWTRLWREGHGDVWAADTGYITQREDQWRQALLG